MLHTLLTFTPLQDVREDTSSRGFLNCIPLTQTLGPIPLASLDANGWAIWEHKVVLVDGTMIQIAPVLNDQVQAPIYCFDVQSRQQAIKLAITKDPQNPGLFYITLAPAGNTPANSLLHTARLSNTSHQPTPALQIISVREKYLTSGQTHSMDFIGTLDSRPGRNAKLSIGNTVTVWAEQDALLLEW